MSKGFLNTLSKHEILFGFTKSATYQHAIILQVVQLTLVICMAWTIMALLTEFGTIISMLDDTAASTMIPL